MKIKTLRATIISGLKLSLVAAVLVGGLTAATTHADMGVKLAQAAQVKQSTPGYRAIDLTSKDALNQSSPAYKLGMVLLRNTLQRDKETTQPQNVAAVFLDSDKTLLMVRVNDSYFCGPALGCMTVVYHQVDKAKNIWGTAFRNQGDEFSIQTDTGPTVLAMRRNGMGAQHTSYWRDDGANGFILMPQPGNAQTTTSGRKG